MNVLDAYEYDKQLLTGLLERQFSPGDRVKLPDGVYTCEDDELAAIVLNGRFIAELEVYSEEHL